jgi:phosphatidate cytidylyltransferase
MRQAGKLATLIGIIVFSLWQLIERDETEMLTIISAVLALLVVFSVVSFLLQRHHSPMALEIKLRTETWWWMVAVLMLAFSTHRIISFFFLGFLCFSALREYYSLMPMREQGGDKLLAFKDRYAVFLTYLVIPVLVATAYVRWYELYIIIVPVYLFLLLPVLFVLQDRTEGILKSLGILSIGVMFFVFCLGHSLFMINLGVILLLFCFALTETRDVISFWVGKGLAELVAHRPGTFLARVVEARIAPTVSPNKTWATGVISALLTGILALLFVPIMPPFGSEQLTYAFAALSGLILGMFGLMGDLAFSMVKRDLHVKDSGNLLPGHGGVIDRVDSLIFTVPITFHLFYWRFF